MKSLCLQSKSTLSLQCSSPSRVQVIKNKSKSSPSRVHVSYESSLSPVPIDQVGSESSSKVSIHVSNNMCSYFSAQLDGFPPADVANGTLIVIKTILVVKKFKKGTSNILWVFKNLHRYQLGLETRGRGLL